MATGRDGSADGDGDDGSARRGALGGWLSGPGGPRESTQAYPGQRLGRPAEGPGSVAGVGRRALALLVDWLLAVLVAGAFLDGLGSFGPLVVFVVVQVLLVGTIGTAVGHRVLGLVVVRPDGSAVGPLPALVRTLLLALVVPAVVLDEDSRGLHDRAAGTVVVRR
ncbi:RDD family protein [Aquipuribacter nitratireducens]|uniref:RDD family protein n=1 Tax=Aquipuribacter nitratireducens TaxID=650104 RepID=A0ABW0GK43_9MICO